MRNFFVCSLLFLFALSSFGHAGEVHSYMGTVTTLHGDASFMLTKTDGKTMDVALSKTTTYQRADGTAATRADLAEGTRVVVTIAKDGRTATKIKLAAPKPVK